MTSYEQASAQNERRLIRDSYVLAGLSFCIGVVFAVCVMALVA